MTLFQIVGLYVALNLILACLLAYRVGQQRVVTKVSLGDGGDFTLLSRMRAHANFIEYAPLVLIGLISMAMLSASPIALHIFGGLFTGGRIFHLIGMNHPKALGRGRTIGAITSLVSFVGIALYLFYLIFFGPTSF